MKIFKEIKRYFSIMLRFFPAWRLYGFSAAFWSLIFPFHHVFGFLRPFLGKKKHKAILSYLIDHYKDIIVKFSQRTSQPVSNIESSSTIWVCWWDGEEAMPDIVKVCWKSIRQHSGKHPVVLITKNNYKEYVSFPDYIMEKVNAKIITITHFSDILRANLLYEHGGIWMDATILTLKDISLEDMPFFTLKAPAKKNNSISMARFSGISDITTPYRYNFSSPKISRWSGFLLAGVKGSIIFEYLRDILYSYWKDHNDQIEYFLVDYSIALGYDNIPDMKRLIDNVPTSTMEKFVLERKLNIEYNDDNFSSFLSVSFHKLSWKNKFDKYTKKQKLTIYGHLINSLGG
jgi:Capsular polysaccharide synthesis protein.